MKTLNAIGFVLLIFTLSDNWIILTLSIIYFIISLLADLYILGDEQNSKKY